MGPDLDPMIPLADVLRALVVLAVLALLAGTDGPISAQHVTGLVNRSTDAGVVWPGPLHVLLEDITARGGRF
ncbi:hypothetical protein RM53_13660 [Brevundimonas nasdae]|uniref:Uncharacterized protein n=1 Tax=Brevundimonas nasdae TaxID=172043 RepID=A0A0B4C4S7_9CAUL|nr:hypothetical protein RM53_13660 [Brevundimonas nasdae]